MIRRRVQDFGSRSPAGGSMTTLLSAALAYARHGYRVLPLEPNGKRPITEHGVHDATFGDLAIHNLFSRPCNLGLAVPDDRLILDVDVRSNGPATLKAWLDKWGPLPMTPRQVTASGGWHVVFRRPTHAVTLRTKLGPGVDLLGLGKYIVSAPSTIDGKPYRWDHRLSTTPVADLPMWLLDMAIVKRDASDAPAPMGERPSADVYERAKKYVASCPGAVSGQGGHNATFLLAQRLVRGFKLDDATALSLMTQWNVTCSPPWNSYQLARKVAEARTKGTMAWGELLDAPRRSA